MASEVDVPDASPAEWSERLGMPFSVAPDATEVLCKALPGCSNVAVWRAVLSDKCGHLATVFCDPCADKADLWMDYCREQGPWPPRCATCHQASHVVSWELLRG